MYYYLERARFLPEMILCGIVMIPSIIGLVYVSIVDFNIATLVTLAAFVVSYFLIIVFSKKTSKRKDEYLLLKDTDVEIVYHDSILVKVHLELHYNQIKQFHYYRMNFIRSWCRFIFLLHIYPKCVFITYSIDEKEHTKFIGYLDYSEAKEISEVTNSEFIVH